MKIELTKQEIKILKSYERGEIDCPSDEAREMLGNLAEKALKYERDSKSGDDPDDLLLWYYSKFKEQH